MTAIKNTLEWSAEEIREMLRLAATGHTLKQAAAALERTTAGVRHRAARIGVRFRPETTRRKSYESHDAMRLRKLQQANLLHLLDLKRAGHSPTRTELQIESDGVPMQLSAPGRPSCSSPALACLEG